MTYPQIGMSSSSPGDTSLFGFYMARLCIKAERSRSFYNMIRLSSHFDTMLCSRLHLLQIFRHRLICVEILKKITDVRYWI